MIWILSSVAIGYLAILLLLYLFQNALLYHPVAHIAYTPAAIGLKYEDVTVDSEDGVRIHGWFVPVSEARGTVLFSHGNAGNISGRLETIRILNKLKMNVLIFDYRGYGKSEGQPTEKGIYQDVLACWNFLVQQKNIPNEKIILMGRSLGGSVSAWLARQTAPAALILESTFTSAADLAQELYPWVPVRWLMHSEYPTADHLQQLSLPVLVLHSREDQLIPFHHGKELYERANDPKYFYEMDGDHGESHIVTGDGYVETLDQFFSEVITEKKTN
jgi:fermentation-respiration switch protein FrsA (DUF1100 family)